LREFAVIVSAVVGAVLGYYVIGGGQGTPAEIIENPDLLTGNTNAMLWMIGGALALPWLVNRWVEHRPKDEGEDGSREPRA
jgi:hypothetical protein